MIEKFFNCEAYIIRLKDPHGIDSETGEPSTEYRIIDKIKCNIDMITSDTEYRYGKTVNNSTHIMTCNYRIFHIDDRIRAEGIIYDVNYVDNPLRLSKHIEVELKISE